MLVSGRTIRRLRGEAKMTQKKLAQLVGISQAHIAKIENEKVDPRLSTVNRILQVLKKEGGRRSRDVMTRGVISAKPDDEIFRVSDVMVRNAVSQLPVLEGIQVVGTITEEDIIRNLKDNLGQKRVGDIMGSPLPTISPDVGTDRVRIILEKHQGVLVVRQKQVLGIITRSDLLKTVE